MFGLGKSFRKVTRNIMEWAMTNEAQAIETPYPNAVPTGRLRGSPIKASSPTLSSAIEDNNRGFNFTVYNATGGKVIQIQSYDPARDRTISSLYIITDKEDLGEELALILTKETLSR